MADRGNGREKNSRRVQNPSHSVVDRLGLGECLMTALVAKNPDTGGKETSNEGIEGPEREAECGVRQRVGELDVGGVNEDLGGLGGLPCRKDDNEIPDTAAKGQLVVVASKKRATYT